MKHEDVIPKYLSGIGVEIGACTNPLPKISPIYVDKFKVYIGNPSNADYLGDAIDLPFFSNSLDYVASSHVLEHIANPVAALEEWYRVLKPGGIVYVVVPDKHYTFDRPRATTAVSHMLDDYFNNVDDTDPTHIDDFIFNRDIKAAKPHLTEAEIAAIRSREHQSYWSKINDKQAINLHFHVFEPSQFRGLIEAVNESKRTPFSFEILQMETQFPSDIGNGILAVLRKPTRGFILPSIRRFFLFRRFRSYPVLPDATSLR